MDETYVRVKGEWMYLYRAVDKIGKSVEFFLSRNRDVNAAKAALLEFGRVMLDPPQNRSMRQYDASFAHHGHQIPVAQLETQIPADA